MMKKVARKPSMANTAEVYAKKRSFTWVLHSNKEWSHHRCVMSKSKQRLKFHNLCHYQKPGTHCEISPHIA
eukprot:1481714-Amphidinium_carterae.1